MRNGSRSRKSLAILLRARMWPRGGPSSTHHPSPIFALQFPDGDASSSRGSPDCPSASVKDVMECMKASISAPGIAAGDGRDSGDARLHEFLKGYHLLSHDGRHELLLSLAKEYDVNRMKVRDLMRQYLDLELFQPSAEEVCSVGSALYRMERSLRDALKPAYADFFERLNAHPGGLKLLAVLRADLLEFLQEENAPSLRALDLYLREKIATWLSPAALVLHQITWEDPASLLEKIVAYEAVHPIKNLIDLRRRLGVGRCCFGYFHPAIPGEPLIFIEVALLDSVATSIQEVLWDDPSATEHEAKCALFYSISSTQPGLSGINLGKFLLKRVIDMVRKDIPSVHTFATLSPIPGFMKWLISKLASQVNLAEEEGEEEHSTELGSSSPFKDNILLPEEEKLIRAYVDQAGQKSGNEIMLCILASPDWSKSTELSTAMKPPLMRLCMRYLIEEKKRGKALDPVANFHLQNGAMVERLNWMADQSDKGMQQSAGIMVNYVYRLENIEEYAESYLTTGQIHVSPNP